MKDLPFPRPLAQHHHSDLINRIAELSLDGIFIEDLQGNILDCNEMGCKIFGYTKEEIVGMNIREFLEEDQAKALPPVLCEEQTTGNEYREKINKRKDGSLFPIEINATHFYIGEQKLRVAFIRDISERKKFESELLQSRKDLLEQNRTKNLILSTISHDLINHMGNIKTLVDIFESSQEYGGFEALTPLIPLLKKSAHNSFDLLESLLDWANKQKNQNTFSPARNNLTQIISSSLQLFSDQAHQKGILIRNHISQDLWGWFDPHLVASVVRNLISNALKFTPNGGHITLEGDKNSEHLYCKIKDTGVGMSKGRIATLFNIKTQSSQPGTNQEKGNGLGLILCKEFIERNHGKLLVESKKDKGSCFTFTLPVHPDFVTQ